LGHALHQRDLPATAGVGQILGIDADKGAGRLFGCSCAGNFPPVLRGHPMGLSYLMQEQVGGAQTENDVVMPLGIVKLPTGRGIADRRPVVASQVS
jgi:hypothetical protein